MAAKNLQIRFKNRPTGLPTLADFESAETEIPRPREGEVLRRTLYLSVDPYMRGRMSAAKSYAKPMQPGDVMVGSTVSQVVESNDARFAPGDFVLGYDGWQTYAVGTAAGLRKLDPAQAPLSYALGVLGMPGLTAYVGLLDIGRPKAGETVVVSAAAGAVGSIAGQIARIKGCRAVGTAGSDEKCAFVVDELGFDACLNYKKEEPAAAFARTCPSGIDVYVENVGGAVLEAVLRHLNVHARVALIGLISQYNETQVPPGPNLLPLLTNRVLLQGMIVTDHEQRLPEFLRDVSTWLREGKLRYREDVVSGLENAPRAFLGLFRGENVGKRIVRLAPDPTRPS
jgi:NADPH-dependent curcumin reductase CurA